jgi:SAM-dependent methyltransferase
LDECFDSRPFGECRAINTNGRGILFSKTEVKAKIAVAGTKDEKIFRESTAFTLSILQKYGRVGKNDIVLEICAGVGRVGAALAPLCREWIGTDVSENMVRYMRRRLAGHSNVRTVAITGFDLAGIPSESVDVVYCTVVFMHLEEWERYSYIKEGFRVRRPGGRMAVDNVNLLSDAGWKFFEEICAIPPKERPAHISKVSTPQELETYFQRAGFCGIGQEQIALWIITYGVKPDAAPAPQ